jgi:hypothetical protein
MNQMRTLFDPTSEQQAAGRTRLPRPASLDGLTVGVLDISKVRGDVFLDQLAKRLAEHGMNVKRYKKATVARPAALEIQQAIAAECDVMVEGLVD